MNKKTVILICVVVALVAVVIILAVNLSGAANGEQPASSASPTASATATGSASTQPTATATASEEPIVHIQNAVMTSGINADGSPTTTVTQYAPEDTFIANVQIDTDDDDPVRFVWYYGGDSFDDETINAKNSYANCELQNQHTWDPGDYMVEVYLQDSTDPDATLNFSVAAPATPSPSASASASASADTSASAS